MRIAGRSFLFAALLSAGSAGLLTSCSSSAYADQVAVPQAPGPRIALAIAGEKVRAPYDVQIVTENGETAPTYAFKGRYYVQGTDNSRYIIRVTNPTPRRVEAVVSVDGLDVVDGEAGDLNKRGYIVPAYGEVRIEGFRTSLADVATFRFSSVDDSYAGRKGKARNVGVIAVALFEEQAPPPDVQIVAPIQPQTRVYHWEDDVDEDGDAEASAVPTRGGGTTHGRHVASKKDGNAKATTRTAAADDARAERKPAQAPGADTGGVMGGEGGAPAARPYMPPPPPPRDQITEQEWQPPVEQQAPRTNRPGLGTEFGESRYSAASYTKFVRNNNRPIAIAELRYNDQAGLMALGIPVAPMPDDGEIMMRETADPFPGDHFARAPR